MSEYPGAGFLDGGCLSTVLKGYYSRHPKFEVLQITGRGWKILALVFQYHIPAEISGEIHVAFQKLTACHKQQA